MIDEIVDLKEENDSKWMWMFYYNGFRPWHDGGAVLFMGSLLHKGLEMEIKREKETENDKSMCNNIASCHTQK